VTPEAPDVADLVEVRLCAEHALGVQQGEECVYDPDAQVVLVDIDIDGIGREVIRTEVGPVDRLKDGRPAHAVSVSAQLWDRATGTEQDTALLLPLGMADALATVLRRTIDEIRRNGEGTPG
jgi:hypothetical protein